MAFVGRDARGPACLVILSAGREAPGVEGSHRLRAPAAAAFPGRDARGPARVRRLGLKRIATCRNPGSQGPMDIYVHRPVCLWFVDLRVRLTKPTQIARTRRLLPRCVHDGHSGCGRVSNGGDWCRFRTAGRGSDARSPCGRPRVSGPQAGAEPGGGVGLCLHIFCGLLRMRTRSRCPASGASEQNRRSDER